MNKIRLLIPVLAICCALLAACSDQIEDPVQTDTVAGSPEIPHNVVALVGDAQIQLAWELSNPGAVRQFFVYRRDSVTSSARIIDSTTQFRYTDRSARNGFSYIYYVATQGNNRLVGRLSNPVLATAGLFSIAIAGGAEYARSTNTSISIAAPSGTRYMMLSNDTTAGSSVWLSFSTERNWELPQGDGVKKVFAKFRDLDGNETAGYSYDHITLDSRAVIDSVTEDSDGQTLVSGDELHLAVYTSEAGGAAAAEINGIGTLTLYDDGGFGDNVAADGVYELDYTIPQAVDVVDQLTIGNFIDRAGNQAQAKSSRSFLNVANPPDPVVLTSYAVTESVIELAWTRSNAGDFSNYLIFRSESSTVDSTDKLIMNETNANNHSYTDQDLEPNTSYRYVVYTQDGSLLKSKSNVVVATTLTNETPATVQLFLSGKSAESVTLGWTRNDDDDFDSYRIYRAGSTGVQRTAENLKGVVTSQNSISFTDNDVETESTYYYVLVVYDKYGGISLPSNEIQVTTDAVEN